MKNAGGHSILNDRLPIEKRYAGMVDKALEPRIAALNNSDLSGGEGSEIDLSERATINDLMVGG